MSWQTKVRHGVPAMLETVGWDDTRFEWRTIIVDGFLEPQKCLCPIIEKPKLEAKHIWSGRKFKVDCITYRVIETDRDRYGVYLVAGDELDRHCAVGGGPARYMNRNELAARLEKFGLAQEWL